jgi:hypothetical protein
MRVHFYSQLKINPWIASCLLTVTACAGVPNVVPISPHSSIGEDKPFDDNESQLPDPIDPILNPDPDPDSNSNSDPDPDPNPGDSPDCSLPQTLTTSLQPNSAQKLNVLLLIDDSGSMSQSHVGQPSTISRVVSNLQSFMQGLTSSVADPADLRLGFTFDESAGAFGGQNPFSQYLSGSSVFHINERTNSQASDIAMFKRFGRENFSQIFPSPFWSDVRGDQYTPSLCALNAYARPTRHNLYESGGSTPYCVNQQTVASRRLAIESVFHQGAALNIVQFTDDDLNVALGPDEMNAEGVRFVANVYDSLVAPLQSRYVYHSVVGTTSADLFQTGDSVAIVRPGTAHMMLSQLTGGSTFDVRSPDYGQVLNSLARQAVFSSQQVNLACSIVASRPVRVFFDGQEISASLYQAQSGERSILFDSSAFQPGDEMRTIQVEVRY